MSAPSGPRALSRGGGRGRARGAPQARSGPQARAGSEERIQDRNRLQPTRGGSMNDTQIRYAHRGRLTIYNGPTARNGPPPQRSSSAAKANPGQNTGQRSSPKNIAGRHALDPRGPATSGPVATNTPRRANTPQNPKWRDPTQVPYAEYKERMHELWTALKKSREQERKNAIRDGFLADPDKPTSLANAITPVGTCKDMCPEFERVERIVQQMVDAAEKSNAPPTNLKAPKEDMMVKRFRRSAAGYDEQLPSDIRPPAVLKKTLNYLLREVVGKNPLAQVHKFVWDRTRGIRNDFSIQQVTKVEDVKIAIDCFERIARFHILSLHLLSHPHQDNGEFDQHQEREQLNNTLLSLMYYYDDNEGKITSYNEPEFRAYCLIFEIQDQRPDAEQRMSSWPAKLLFDERVMLAYDLYNAACNILNPRGPLRPQSPFAIAHESYSRFWAILKDPAVPYLMACTAEIHFDLVRAMALEIIWKTYRRGNAKLDDWTLADLMPVLGFDTEDQVATFCEEHGFQIEEKDDGSAYLDVTSVTGTELTDMNPRRKQVCSFELVESKRMGRTIPGVIQGLSVSACKRIGQIEKLSKPPTKTMQGGGGGQLFLSDDEDSQELSTSRKSPVPAAKPVSTMTATNPLQTTKPTSNPFQSIGQLGNTTQKATLHNPFAALQKPGASSATPLSNPFQTSAASSAFSSPSAPNPFQITKPTSNPFSSIPPAPDTSEQSGSVYDSSQTSTEYMGRQTKAMPATNPFMTSTPTASPFVNSFTGPAGSTAIKPASLVFGQPSGTGNVFGTPASSAATPPALSVFSQPSRTVTSFGVPTDSPAVKLAPFVFGQPFAGSGSTTFGQPSESASPFGSPSKLSTPPSTSAPFSLVPPSSNKSTTIQGAFSSPMSNLTELASKTSEPGNSNFPGLQNVNEAKTTLSMSSATSPATSSTPLDPAKSVPDTGSPVFQFSAPAKQSIEQTQSVFSNLQNSSKQRFTFDTSASGAPPAAVAAYEAYKDWKPPSTPAFSFTTPAAANIAQGIGAVTDAGAITNGQTPGSDLFSRIRKSESSDLASRITELPKPDLFSRTTRPESSDLGTPTIQPPSSDLGSRIEQPETSKVDQPPGQSDAATTAHESPFRKLPTSFPQSTEPVQQAGIQFPSQSKPSMTSQYLFTASSETQSLSASGVSSMQPVSNQAQNPSTCDLLLKPIMKKPSPILGTQPATPTTLTPPTFAHTPITGISNANTNTQNMGKSTGLQPAPLGQQPDGASKGGVPFISLTQSQINAAKSGLRERVLDTLAHEMVCANDGVLDQYLQHSINPIVIKAMNRVMRQQERQTVMIAREFLLSKKYGRKWKDLAYKRVLQRKGREKRKRFAESMREMSQNAFQASNGPLDRDSPAEKRPRVMPPPPKPLGSILKNKNLPTQTNNKRPAQETEDPRQAKKLNRSPPPSGDVRVKPHHKRSQTLGDLGHASGSVGDSQKQRLFFSPKPPKAVDTELSIDAMREKARRMRIPLGPQDSTKTDYFLLKSYGLDPDTPLYPALRKRGASDENDVWAPGPKRMSPSRSYRLSTQSAPDSGSQKRRATNEDDLAPNPKRMSPPRGTLITQSAVTNGGSSTRNPQPSNVVATTAEDDDDALFAQVRQVREAMSESVSFYREALRRSSSETEKEKKFRELKYTPSRSEVRLKTTGARGLLPKDWEFGSSIGNGNSIGKRRDSDVSFRDQSQSRDEFHNQGQSCNGNTANMSTPTLASRAINLAALNNSSGAWMSSDRYPESSNGNGGMGVRAGTGASADDAIEL